jgi:hypothetical protein
MWIRLGDTKVINTDNMIDIDFDKVPRKVGEDGKVYGRVLFTDNVGGVTRYGPSETTPSVFLKEEHEYETSKAWYDVLVRKLVEFKI